MTSPATVQTSAEDGVFTITLNRPAAVNALNEPLSTELAAALHTARRDDQVRCIILTGAGRAFCAGQDLKVLDANRDPQTGAPQTDFAVLLRQHYNRLIVLMRTMEKPIIAAVNGAAAGAGFSLALAADLRIAARSASFLMAFVRVGLLPDCAATLTIVQHVGYARAAELCLLGEPLSAEEAHRCGLVNRVVDDDQLPDVTRQFARKLAAMPTRAVGLTKTALNQAWTATLDQQLEYEAFVQAAAGWTADHREGLDAFLAKRQPRFTGK
jgi:2-(1,2-epoxy-1,2-dihydrophenyl)acetyl-CoA isomerase